MGTIIGADRKGIWSGAAERLQLDVRSAQLTWGSVPGAAILGELGQQVLHCC